MAALQPPAGGQVPHSPIFLRKSFADLFSDKSSTPSFSVQATPSMHKGEPAILFSQDALDKLATPYRFALVGKFSRGGQNWRTLELFFSSWICARQSRLGCSTHDMCCYVFIMKLIFIDVGLGGSSMSMHPLCESSNGRLLSMLIENRQ